MSAILLDGKALKEKKFVGLKARVGDLQAKNITPHLAVVLVGDHPASRVYVSHKEKACLELGIKSSVIHLPEKISFLELATEVRRLNDDSTVHGVMVQFPLPKHMDHDDISLVISPDKDADGICPQNQGINLTRAKAFAPLPCTAHGIMELLDEYQVPIAGRDALVVGRSNIVGRPIAYLLANANATVWMAHSQTVPETFIKMVATADLIILATGQPDLITPQMIKTGATIIDVGIIRLPNGKLRGDILYQNFLEQAGFISPVPGGVGPLTVAMLMENVVKLAENSFRKD